MFFQRYIWKWQALFNSLKYHKFMIYVYREDGKLLTAVPCKYVKHNDDYYEIKGKNTIFREGIIGKVFLEVHYSNDLFSRNISHQKGIQHIVGRRLTHYDVLELKLDKVIIDE